MPEFPWLQLMVSATRSSTARNQFSDFLPDDSAMIAGQAALTLLVISLAAYYLLYARLPHLRTEFFR